MTPLVNKGGRGPVMRKRCDEAIADLLAVVTGHAEVTDLGRYAAGLTGLADWYAQGRPQGA